MPVMSARFMWCSVGPGGAEINRSSDAATLSQVLAFQINITPLIHPPLWVTRHPPEASMTASPPRRASLQLPFSRGADFVRRPYSFGLTRPITSVEIIRMIRGTGLGLLVLGIVTEAWGGAPHAIPLRFEPSGGQSASEASFVCRAAGHTAYLRPDRAIFAADGAVVRMSLLGSNPSAQAVGLEPLESVANYLVGPDETRWRTGVSGFARVEFREVYPGVNLVYYGTEGRLEYDFVLSPGADPAQIRLRFDGAREIRVDSEGDLILPTAQGEFRHTQAQMYQIRQGRRHTVA